jgi:tRNA (cmo5U34)-methyltransferase
MKERTEQFADPQAVARYAEGPSRIVPGFARLQCMTTLLLGGTRRAVRCSDVSASE